MLTQDPGTLSPTNPLAMQFMTQGQMGYMPQAQFLTPAEYGAFRTMPNPADRSYLNQDPGFFQSYLIRNRGSILGLPAYTFNTYNPAVNLQEYMYRMNTQSMDQMMGFGATAADVAGGTLAGMGLGMAFGLPGVAASFLLPSLSGHFTDRIRDMRAIQQQTMSKIVGGRDVNLATGMGFNASAGREMDSFLRMSGAGDVVLKDGDWRKLLQLGIENGQFDYAQNVNQYKDILKTLRGSLTTMMEVCGSTDFKDLMKEFKRFQTMGANLHQYKEISRQENMFARMTGLSHADMVSTYGQQGALIYTQNGLTGYQGSLQSMNNAATIAMGQRMGLIDPGMLSRYGGASGLAQTMTQQDAQSHNKMMDLILPYMMNKSMTGLDPNADLSKILQSNNPMQLLTGAVGQKISSPEDMMKYQQNRHKLYDELMQSNDAETVQAVMANRIGYSAGMGKGREATLYGFRMLGLDAETAALKTQKIYSQEFQEVQQRERALARKKAREEEELANNPFRKFARHLDEVFTKWGEASFGAMARGYGNWNQRNADIAEGYGPPLLGATKNLNMSLQLNRGEEIAKNRIDTGVWNLQASDSRNNISDWLELGADFAKQAGGSAAVKTDAKRGTLFGQYEFSSKNGVFDNFIKFLEKHPDKSAQEVAKRFRQEGADLSQTWRDVATDSKYAKSFSEWQATFARKEIYEKALAKLPVEEQQRINGDEGMQKALFAASMRTAGLETEIELPSNMPVGEASGNVTYKYGRHKTIFDENKVDPETEAMVRRVAREVGVDEEIALGIMYQESRGNKNIALKRDKKGRVDRDIAGLFQVQIATGIGIKELGYTREDIINNPEKNARAGLTYFKQMLAKYNGNAELALSAYNWGPGALDEYLRGKRGMNRETAAYASDIFRRLGGSAWGIRSGDPSRVGRGGAGGSSGGSRRQMSNREAISLAMQEVTEKYSGKVKYEIGKENVSVNGVTDCSGWVKHGGAEMMRRANEIAGRVIYSENDIRKFQEHRASGKQVKFISEQLGQRMRKVKGLTAEQIKPGMIIGIDASSTRGHDLGIDHVAYSYTDSKTGKTMISESAFGVGVRGIEADKWLNSLYGSTKKGRYGKDTSFVLADMAAYPGGDPDDKIAGATMSKQNVSAATAKAHTAFKTGKDGAPALNALAWIDNLLEQGIITKEEAERFKKESATGGATQGLPSAEEQMRLNAQEEEKLLQDSRTLLDMSVTESAMSANGMPLRGGHASLDFILPILNRYRSGIDFVNGEPDYIALKNKIGSISGGKEIDALQLSRALEKNKDLGSNWDDPTEAKNQLEKTLKDAGLSKDQINKILADQDAVNALMSTRVALSGGTDPTGNKAYKDMAGKVYKTESLRMKEWMSSLSHKNDEAKAQQREAYLGGQDALSSLGSDYDGDIKNIEDAMYGENGIFVADKLVRLTTLLKAYQTKPDAELEQTIREEAARYGYSKSWVDQQLKNPNAITLNEFLDSRNSFVKKEHLNPALVRSINRIGSALGKIEDPSSIERRRRLIENPRKAQGTDIYMTPKMRESILAYRSANIAEIVRRAGLDSEKDLFKKEGLEKAYQNIVKEGRGDPRMRETIERAYKKVKTDKKGLKSLRPEDFFVDDIAAPTNWERMTHMARHDYDKTAKARRDLQQADYNKQLDANSPQYQADSPNKPSEQGGGGLKDTTVNRLSLAIEALVQALHGKGVRLDENQAPPGPINQKN